MKIGFDLISDLNLSPNSPFDWEGKATSLYCIVAGNISPDLRTVINVLQNLGSFYQGVFYIPGSLEYQDVVDIDGRTNEIVRLCKRIRNVSVLYQHVVIIDGIAILGCNGWFGNTLPSGDEMSELQLRHSQIDDLKYLKNSIEKLQKHLDVTKIVLVTNSVPHKDLYFGEVPAITESQVPLNIVLMADTMDKITHWVFGTHKKIVDTVIDSINYVNNPFQESSPYWAKRIDVEI